MKYSLKYFRTAVFWSFVLFTLCALPRYASAYLIFDQSPPNENYNGTILDSSFFLSFGCTLNLDCGLAIGEKIYRVGVWMKKVGNPDDVRLAVIGNLNTVASSTALFSESVSANSLSATTYTLVWSRDESAEDVPSEIPKGPVAGMRAFSETIFTLLSLAFLSSKICAEEALA